jgi:hypothetical protein
MFLVHATAAILTFQRSFPRPGWTPLLTVNSTTISIARGLLGLSIVNFLIVFVTFLYAEFANHRPFAERIVPLILTSFILTNTIYIVIHWGLRPENVFTQGFLRGMASPFSLLKLRKRPRGPRKVER